MQIVTDSSINLSPEQRAALPVPVHTVPLHVELNGKSYRCGVDITPDELYHMMVSVDTMPATRHPSPEEFAETYRSVAQADPDILSIHLSSGQSDTVNAARRAAEAVPEANVIVHDTRTLSVAAGWQLEAAAKAAAADWQIDWIIDLMQRIHAATTLLFTLDDLKYMIHGGRISHITGLIASILDIKPVITVLPEGIYGERGRVRSFKRAIHALVDLVEQQHGKGAHLRTQIVHVQNPEGTTLLKNLLDQRFSCNWLPTTQVAPVIAAHAGWTVVGVIFAFQQVFDNLLPR